MLKNILVSLYQLSNNNTYAYEPQTQLIESISALSFAIIIFIFIIYKASN